jgi:GNAT superfamily N-acetyltransferase
VSLTASVTIRALRESDRAGWEPLWSGYQTFYKVEIPREVSDLTFTRLLDPREPMHGFVAESGGVIVGIVHCIFLRSTWTQGPNCYLQDLFTTEAVRGRGVGRALIEAVYELARKEGASRVYWLTHETNAVAMALYDKIADRSGFVQYRKTL